MTFSGPVFSEILSKMSNISEFQQFRRGELSRINYSVWATKYIAEHNLQGRDAHKVYLSTRLPSGQDTIGKLWIASEEDTQIDVLSKFHCSLVPPEYDHGTYQTYIFPEEEHILRRLVAHRKPSRIVFIGSYYGFWAASIMPIVQQLNVEVVLIDIDPEALGLSESNGNKFGWDRSVQYICDDAAEYLKNCGEQFDLAVLDAEGPQNGPVKERCGKRIYAPLTSEISSWLKPNGALIAHNIMMRDISGTDYTKKLVEKHHDELSHFLKHVRNHFSIEQLHETTEGVGIWVNQDN